MSQSDDRETARKLLMRIDVGDLDAVETRARALANARARERANAAPQWTREPPTVPGWYWVTGARGYDKEKAVAAEVFLRTFSNTLHVYVPGMEHENDLSEFDLWCGPITPPEVPQ